MNVDGTNQRRLTSLQGFSGVPVWSPRGAQIAFQHTAQVGKSPWHLYVMASDATQVTELNRRHVE